MSGNILGSETDFWDNCLVDYAEAVIEFKCLICLLIRFMFSLLIKLELFLKDRAIPGVLDIFI